MHRRPLLQLLASHRPADQAEARSLAELTAFVGQHPDCFERTLRIGHVTGSAWLVSRGGDRVLLTHHRKLDLWLQLGGHCDGDADVLAVAMREAREESGIDAIEPVSEAIFDVDVHPIPAGRGEEGHKHYDVRFLLRVTGDERFRVSDESHELAWVTPGELPRLHTDASVIRMCSKWIRLVADGRLGETGIADRGGSRAASTVRRAGDEG